MTENTASGNDADNGGGAVFNNLGTVAIARDTTLSGNIADGIAGSGGAILNQGTLTINGAEISDNIANRAGGGIEGTPGSTCSLSETDLSRNVAGPEGSANPGSGGAIHLSGDATAAINGGEARGNFAAAEGGAVWNGSGTSEINFRVMASNQAAGDLPDQGGGALYNLSGTVNLGARTLEFNAATGTSGSGGAVLNKGTLVASGFDITFRENSANRAGGAVEGATGSTNTFTNVDFTSNTAGANDTANPGNGGAIHLSGDATASITGGSARLNSAASEGGAFWNDTATMDITNTSFTSNTAAGAEADNGGGAVFNNGGTLNLTDTTFQFNSATGESGSGGALLTTGGTVTITGSTFTINAANRAGGAIEAIDGELIISDSTFGGGTPDLGNTTGPNPGNGGALHISGIADTTATGILVQNNTAAREGGGFWNQSGATMTIVGDTTFSNNTANGPAADDGGGAIFNNGGVLNIEGEEDPGVVLFDENSAPGEFGSGGAIFNNTGGTVDLQGDIILSSNFASRAGGAIEDKSNVSEGLSGGLDVGDVIFRDNSTGTMPGNGGAVHVTGSGRTGFIRCTFEGNTAAAEGGALWNGTGSMLIEASTILNNTASGNDSDQGGGGIFNAGGNLTVNGISPTPSLIVRNIANGTSGSGGGILSDGGTLNLAGVAVSENTANRAGGGIEVIGQDTPDNPTSANFVGVISRANTAGPQGTAAPGNGGAHHTTGPANVPFNTCLITQNTAANQGGGLWNSGSAFLEVVSCLVAGNRAGNGSAGGGGIYSQSGDDGFTSIINSTISSNLGGGIEAQASLSLFSTTVAKNNPSGLSASDLSLSMVNSILADNASIDVAITGTALEATNSIIETGEFTAITSSGNIFGIDPLLSSIQGNIDFLTFASVHKPMPGSVAINAGTNAALPRFPLINDVRGVGFPRVTGGIIDIGSVEGDPFTYQDFVRAFFRATPNEDRDPEDNPDGDALSNALEYLFGTDPEDGSDGSPIQVTDIGDSILLSYPIAPGVPGQIDSIETSTDLTGFTLDDTLTRDVALVNAQAIATIELPKEDGIPTKFARIRATPEIPAAAE